MKTKFIKTFLLFFVLTKTLSATQARLELVDVNSLALENETTPQPTVFVGAPFRLKVVISQGDRNTGEVSIQEIEKLQVQGRSQNTNISMINGSFMAENTFFYDVYAQSEGTFQIGPAQVTQNGNVIKSNTVQFRAVNQPKDASKIKSATGEPVEVAQQNQELVCELLADKKTVFQGEPFTVKLKITVNDQIAELRMEPVNFQGFTSKEVGQPVRRQELRANKVIEIVEKDFAVIPMQTGNRVIEPAKIIYQVPVRTKHKQNSIFGDAFFSGLFDQMQLQQKQTLSNNLKIDVRPLPPTNEPVDGIGKFKSFAMSTDKTSALVNEAITLTLELDGAGNFDQIATPKLQMPDFIKNYESKNDFAPNTALGFFGGKKKFEYVVQVSTSGSIKIPAQKFNYFDTDSKTYKTLQTNEITLQITLPAGEQLQTPKATKTDQQEETPKTPKVFSKDIGFIEEDLSAYKSGGWHLPLWLFLILVFLPIIIVFNAHKKLSDYCRTSSAFKIFSKKTALSKFQIEFTALTETNQAEKIYVLFLNLLATKFDVETQQITTDFVEQKLLKLGWDDKKIGDFSEYLNECASLHFITTKQKTDPAHSSNLFKKGLYWIMLLINQNS